MNKYHIFKVAVILILSTSFTFLIFNGIRHINKAAVHNEHTHIAEMNPNKNKTGTNNPSNNHSESSVTPSASPTVTPSASPTVAPTAKPTATPDSTPADTPASNISKSDLNVTLPNGEKDAYLTIDDGPSDNTHPILQILKENGVNATFFVVGHQAEMYPGYIKDEYNSGNMVLPHCYNHNYSIYSTFDSYYGDLNKAINIINNQLGFNVPHIVRFPGGTNNISSYKYGGKSFMYNLTKDMLSKNYCYLDWNIDSGDALSKRLGAKDLMNNILKSARGKSIVMILCHDLNSKKATVEMLSPMIKTLKNDGYKFKTLRNISDNDWKLLVKYNLADRQLRKPAH